nr:hypothetical protein [Hyphomicrobium methylovorum]
MLTLAAASAGATEVCVKCTGPDASYACVVNAQSDGQLDTATNLYCITALAKAGQHSSCSIDRNTRAPCQGERKELPIPAGLGGVDEEPAQEAATPPAHQPSANVATAPEPHQHDGAPSHEHADEPAPGEEPNAGKPPKTVLEMVEKGSKSASDNSAVKSAGTALQNAGAAVGDAAKTSWKCLSSFFSKC